MRKLFSNGLAMFAGMVSLPLATSHAGTATPATAEYRNQPDKDPRLACLRAFFEGTNCPAASLSPVFLEASDTYALDWRLLPSISFVESTGGKSARNNNIFGWDSGRAVFSSAIACIRSVAYSLSHSHLYRYKNVDGILRTYNPNADYARKVKSVMLRIASSEMLD
jgi:hypothetical protein